MCPRIRYRRMGTIILYTIILLSLLLYIFGVDDDDNCVCGRLPGRDRPGKTRSAAARGLIVLPEKTV